MVTKWSPLPIKEGGTDGTTPKSARRALGISEGASSKNMVSVKDFPFGAKGDGVTDDTAAIQAAIDAVVEGGTIYFPAVAIAYVFSTLTITRTVTLLGGGWKLADNGFFGTSYAGTVGTVLKSTATSGSAITATTINKQPRFENIALLGPGSGTSTGITFGSVASYQTAGKWLDVFIANFSIGVTLTNVQDYSFYSLRIRGCTTALKFVNTTNQNCFYGFEAQSYTDGIRMEAGSLNDFYGGLLQNGTNGIILVPSAAGGLEAPHFDGFWFEGNTNNIKFDTTTGPVTNFSCIRTRASGGVPIAYAGANTIGNPAFWKNMWSGLAVTLGANMSSAWWGANNTGAVTNNGTNTVFVDLANTIKDGSAGQFYESGNNLLYAQTGVANRFGLGITDGIVTAYNKIYPGTDAAANQAVAGIYAGNGAPNNANGANGDFYFRGDGTQAGNTVIYHKQTGAWVALITT